MKAPLKLEPLAPKARRTRQREIERDFHVRAFGEELAHVNLDLTPEERIQYINWMRQNALNHSVNLEQKCWLEE